MSSYSSVALVGAGDFGTIFATTLAANPAFNSVVVITRPESASAKQVPAGTKVAEADLTKVDSVAAVLKEHKVDVVISTLGFAGLSSGSQVVVADAAKAAGVKLFVPSEWGFPTIGATEGLFGVKESNAKHLASIGVPSLRVFVSTVPQSIYFASSLSIRQVFSPHGCRCSLDIPRMARSAMLRARTRSRHQPPLKKTSQVRVLLLQVSFRADHV